jgi:hypothetical protein
MPGEERGHSYRLVAQNPKENLRLHFKTGENTGSNPTSLMAQRPCLENPLSGSAMDKCMVAGNIERATLRESRTYCNN